MRKSVFFILPLIIFASTGCDYFPRGETKTLETIAGNEATRFNSALNSSADKNLSAKANLDRASTLLENFKSAEAEASVSNELAGLLTTLSTTASYTNRPAFGELTKQYLNLAAPSNQNISARKLLAARTYSLLANELETLAFQVN